MLFHDCNVTWSWVWHSLQMMWKESSFHKTHMALIAQSHLLLMLLCQSKGHFLFKLLSELVFVFSLNCKCSYVPWRPGYHMSQTALHVRQERVQRLLTKKNVYGNSKFHFFNVTPRFSPRNYCFVFCNLKAAISTFLRYSTRPKHVWKENKYMKRDWLVYFQCAEYIRLLFILWVDVIK